MLAAWKKRREVRFSTREMDATRGNIHWERGTSEYISRLDSRKDVVCEMCGDVGYKHLLVQCNDCHNASRHRYCLDPIIYDGSSIEWFCDDCSPKHNEAVKSLKERGGNHHSIQLGSSMINEPNVNRVEVTKELWPWGRRRRRSHKGRRYSTWGCCKPRSHKARRDSTDASTKCGDTFNLSEIFVEEKSCNAVFKERGSENDRLIYQPENADGASQSASDLAAEIQKKPIVNTIECLDLSTGKDSCSFSQSYVEGSNPQVAKADFPPLINGVERSHPFVTDDSCPIFPIAEQEDVSSHALGSAEQPHPFEVVSTGGSSHSPLDPALKIEEQGIEAGLFVLVNDVEQYCPLFTDEAIPTLSSEEQVDGSSPMSESWEQPDPLDVIKPCDDLPKSILGSVPQSLYSQRMQGSDPQVGNMDVLDPSKDCLDSRSMSKNEELSGSSDRDGNSAVEKDNAERTKYLSGTETVTPALDNVKGSRPSAEPSSFSNGGDSAVKEDSERTECLSGMEPAAPALEIVQGSSPSTTKGCLVSSVDNSDEANRSDKRLLCTEENKELVQLNVLSCPKISSGEVHCSHCDLNENSNPKPTLKGRNLQKDVRKISVSGGKNGLYRHLQNDVNNEALPSKHVSACKATKSSFKKQHDEPNSTPHHTKHQKTKSIMKDRNAYPSHPRSRRPSKQPDLTCLSASSELSSKTKKVNNANDAEPRCSRSVPTYENAVPKKRKQHLPYDEDAKAMRMKEANSLSSENDGQVKVHRRCVESVLMNQRSAENYEVPCRGNSTNQYVNDHTWAKKQRRINKDKKAPLVNSSVPCAHNDAAQVASATVEAEGHCSLSRMPAVSGPTDQQHFICMQPIDRPYWTGIMKIGQEYISLAAHLSNQACKKVQELSRSLPPVMKVTEHSKLKAWPKRWEALEPTDESIGLYFFSDYMRPNKDLDRLLQRVTEHNTVLKYVFESANLLIFPSVLLPEQCQMFQGKHYLWGVFKRRNGTSKEGSPVKQKIRASQCGEKKSSGKISCIPAPWSKKRQCPEGIPLSESQLSPGGVHGVGWH